MACSTRSRRTSRSTSSICSPSTQSSAAIHSDRRLSHRKDHSAVSWSILLSHDARVVTDAHPVSDLGRWLRLGDLNHVNLRSGTNLLGFRNEGSLTTLSVALREPVRGKAPDGRSAAHVDTSAMLGRNQAFVLEQA